ncbi:phosphoribosylformylglycinamidine synthase, clade II [Halobacteroides halobius DSM 5150]|uniref:Phosphoribosylformylglycinamidine synthase, clade II n=1 Tax=Halobacteroides halobius (strain ATCC 35273 / DSM 5150 / MD-1) TaxID=748449 RepID=L0KAX8_HALHC|nr:phosphoribosylformylglycinamidine synthase [Halobacteroides halobius]AGB42452.1 phosphoribosylformylglycinamidine synthase, clade II [Halobacteroides halobius DSM 5150]
MSQIRRVYVEKKEGYNVEAKELLEDLKQNLQLENLEDLRIVNRYDISGISQKAYNQACHAILSEPPVDKLYEEKLELAEGEIAFGVEYLPGQYDQRSDSAEQCMQILNNDEKPIVRNARIIVLQGELAANEIKEIKDYYINPVDSREANLDKPDKLEMEYSIPTEVEIVEGFIEEDEAGLEELLTELGLAMSKEDLLHTQKYFKDTEKRNPTITEIKVLDTYWSDHCRHTTFLTSIEDVKIEENKYTKPIESAYEEYLAGRKKVYPSEDKDICLMDIALMGMKELRKEGRLEDLEVSDEVNASSIIVPVDVDGEEEEWLVMFKNETHNHPTEIEPFGGAATCLGGCIRDPLAGRSYVYQAMRISGSGDPRVAIEDTIPGKLPQRKIAQEASDGYSSYGNQIGVATGIVNEIYDERYLAKHMEIGAVVAATPKEDVVRGDAKPGDIVVLVGGRTGRDGCGGATGSSKEHTKESIEECGAEVQKGNPPTERKILRLFRNSKVSRMIKKCNDFGAGGVAVAIGELADALEVDLNAVPKKYAGLDGTELAISESQERMAVVIDQENVEEFKELATTENLEATVVAKVKDHGRLIMNWNGDDIINLSRGFLDTSGATQETKVVVTEPEEESYFSQAPKRRLSEDTNLKQKWFENLSDINVCSQKGLVEKFDSTVGANSVLMPYGGKHQLTPTQSMVAKIPTLEGDTTTGTIMSYGFDSKLATWSPFHGALYAVIESVAKVVATGGEYEKIRFTFQEYFESLRDDYKRWGKPFSALLGAYQAQKEFGLPAIGGKDSMSGTFHDLDVPPTLVSFAVDTVDVNHVISPEFKSADSKVVYVPLERDEAELPNFNKLKLAYDKVNELIKTGKVLSARAVTLGGLAEAVTKMSLGNKIGMTFQDKLEDNLLFTPDYGSLVLEIGAEEDLDELFGAVNYRVLGRTNAEEIITVNGLEISITEAIKVWEEPLEDVYKTKTERREEFEFKPYQEEDMPVCKNRVDKPKVLIPVFPGTNCEYDTAKQFKEAGAEVETLIFKNLEPEQIEDSIYALSEAIKDAQIVALVGGFSAGDEPEGAGKFIATVFRNPKIKEAVNDLLNNRDGLMIGICNGFQALIKLGLVPYGEIRELTEDAPTLTYNEVGRHISCVAQTKIVSNKSPWLSNVDVGDVHSIPVSHGEGRFVASAELVEQLLDNGQVATQYVDFAGVPTSDIAFNPNGSVYAIEGITSPDGRILGKMGHSERIGTNVAKNIIGKKDQQIFKAGVEYFAK